MGKLETIPQFSLLIYLLMTVNMGACSSLDVSKSLKKYHFGAAIFSVKSSVFQIVLSSVKIFWRRELSCSCPPNCEEKCMIELCCFKFIVRMHFRSHSILSRCRIFSIGFKNSNACIPANLTYDSSGTFFNDYFFETIFTTLEFSIAHHFGISIVCLTIKVIDKKTMSQFF